MAAAVLCRFFLETECAALQRSDSTVHLKPRDKTLSRNHPCLVLRTNFSNEDGWTAVCRSIQEADSSGVLRWKVDILDEDLG